MCVREVRNRLTQTGGQNLRLNFWSQTVKDAVTFWFGDLRAFYLT